MRTRIIVLGLAVLMAAAACASKKESFGFAEGSAGYTLAKELAATLPALDPETNTVLATSRSFEITAAEVLRTLMDQAGPQVEQLKSMPPERLKLLIGQGAEQIGQRRLLLEASAGAGTVPGEADVTAALDAQYAQAGGEAAFKASVEGAGLSLEFVRTSIRENLTIQKYLDGVLGAAGDATEAEVLEAYGRDKTASVRHILRLTQGKSEAEKAAALETMEGLLARARGGEDFAALAKEFSEDPGSQENGGLYENFPRGQMVKPFEDAAFAVPVGEISGIVETAYGYHILKIEGREKETRPLDEVREEIASRLGESKRAAAFEAHVEGLKKAAGFTVTSL